jgi:hypothetical protein
MANNPVQIVLNSQHYIRRSDVNPGGKNKDFFEGRNAAFIEHRDQLANQIESIQNSLSNVVFDDVFYAQVELQSEAWAKSHRPVQKIFPIKNNVSFAGNTLGSIIVELTPQDIPRVAAAIMSAEDAPKTAEKNNKVIEKPSRARSEVGAIKSIRIYSLEDKRKFSTDMAIKWLADSRTGHAYYVEVFLSPSSTQDRVTETQINRVARNLNTFERQLKELNLPIEISQVSNQIIKSRVYIVKLLLDLLSPQQVIEANTKLLEFLDKQAIVRSVILPAILQSALAEGDSSGSINIPIPDPDESYPVIGIIDSGVANIATLNEWSSGSSDYPIHGNQDVSHGTFIAGLISNAETLNPDLGIDTIKCKYFDLNLHPTSEADYTNYYPHGFVDFLEQLDAEIPAAKEKGVRVFNMSLAITSPVADDSYGLFANMLDEIADKHDVIFVLPAGNLDKARARDEWPEDDTDALAMLAEYRFQGQDKLYQPSESIRALVVGALNPPDAKRNYFPARYSRRGPGPSLGAKPDLAHIGGRFEKNSGLQSLNPNGNCMQSCGTSYSAPLVARTAATLDHAIQGGVSREAITALVIHHAKTPSNMLSKHLKQIRKDFIGAGIPAPVSETLLVDDHTITLVFNGVLYDGHELRFQFAWPSSLVNSDGACSGNVKLTLVHRPPVDLNQKGEFVRVNLDAYLRQEEINKTTGEITFRGRLKGDGAKREEKELVKHGAKWWPIKVFEDQFKSKGHSSQWRLVIDPLCRSNFAFPEEGISFSVVLTISDDNSTAPIFNEMRLQLQNDGANVADIRSALQTRVR